MSSLDWISYCYRNGERIFELHYPLEDRRVYIKVEKWIPLLFVDGKELELAPFANSVYPICQGRVDGVLLENRQVNMKGLDAMNHRFEGEIAGYRFRVHREDVMVDSEVIDPDGTVWTTRSGPSGLDEYVSVVPWDGVLLPFRL